MARTRRRKKRTHIQDADDPSKKGQPKSFVLKRGRHAAVLKDLEKDIRRLMSPNTATNLKENKKNVLKDFVHVAGPLGVTHLLMLTATHNAAYLRVAKTPRGPTITFRVRQYALIRDIVSAQQRPRAPASMWLGPPLVVMNNFNVPGAEHLKLATVMFQNMFPSINVATTKLSACQRVLMLDYDQSAERISLRHYSISAAPSGVTKNLKSLLGRKKLPDLGKMTDVADFLTKSGYGSESEGEDAEAAKVTLAEDLGKGNKAARQSRIKLHEVGPRMELEIIKVEEGLCEGRVLYHKYESRSKEQVRAKDAEMEEKRRVKEKRRREQEENVRKKEALKAQKAEAKAASAGKDGKTTAAGQPFKDKRKKKEWWEKNDPDAPKTHDDDDDAEYYRQEVGEDPEEGDFFNKKKDKGAGGSGHRGGGRGGSRGGGVKKPRR